jgi:hypothetical protein
MIRSNRKSQKSVARLVKNLGIGVFVGVLVLLTAAPSFSQAPIPQRKPGLWEEIHMSKIFNPKPVRGLHCVGQGPDHGLDFEMGDISDGSCTPTKASQKQGLLVLEKQCPIGKSITNATATYKGKLDSSYEAVFHTRISPAHDGLTELTGTLKARWLGPCQPGQRPGDIIGDGVNLNLLDIRKTPIPKCPPSPENRGGARPAPAPC